MIDDVSDEDGEDFDRAPICPYCGVTALAGEIPGGSSFVCENPDCDAFGESVDPPSQ